MRSFLSLIFLLFYSSVSIATEKRILITAFEPFGFASINRSQDTANSIKKELEQKGFSVDICVLPVVYDAAAKHAKSCYESLPIKPSLVISLGEGGCDLRLETAAHNQDSSPGFPDNNGNIRVGISIDKTMPKSIGFKSFVADMYCGAPEETKKSIAVSESPGGFVCNNTAFHLGNYFSTLNLPYTFIHVPNNSCSQNSDLAIKSGVLISKMLIALPQFKSEQKIYSLESLCKNLPITVQQAKNFKQIIISHADTLKKICGVEFVNKLKERLEQWKEKTSTY